MRYGTTPRIATVLGMVCALAACPRRPLRDDDGNGEYQMAMRASPSVVVQDRVDERRDPVDWRYVSHFEDAVATLTLRVGDPFKGHQVEGDFQVYDIDAQPIDGAEIRPGESRYEVHLPMKARKRYYVKIAATKGAAAYTLETRFDAVHVEAEHHDDHPVDADSDGLEPPPTAPCADACPDGFVCDEDASKCVPAPCGGPCPSGTRCRRGQCKATKPPKHPCATSADCPHDRRCIEGRCAVVPAQGCGTDADCRPGAHCEDRQCKRPSPPSNACEADDDCPNGTVCAAGQCKPRTAGIRTMVTTILPIPSGLTLRLSRGAAAGLTEGDVGRIQGTGATCKVVKVSANRSDCKTPLDLRALGTARTVTFSAP